MSPSTAVPAIFAQAVRGLRSVRPRPEITLEEVSPPARLAPYAYALFATVQRAAAARDVGSASSVGAAGPRAASGPTPLRPGATPVRGGATAANARVADDENEVEVASGRLILLHDPAGHEAWEGTLRLVTYVTAEVEPEMATDPMLPEVGWSWLTDALDHHHALYKAAAGTVTQTLSTRFGDLSGTPPTADVEIRASWTPVDRGLEAHLDAWCTLLASTAGLPPPGVVALPARLGLV